MTSVASQKSVNWRAEPEVQETGRTRASNSEEVVKRSGKR